jgi:signal transduction histidine kinase
VVKASLDFSLVYGITMKSIKIKFFLLFTITFILLIVLFISINNSFLKQYYTYSIKQDFFEYYEKIDQDQDENRLIQDLFILSRKEAINSMVIDRDNNVVFDSLQRTPIKGNTPLNFETLNTVPAYIGQIISDNQEILEGQYYYDTVAADNEWEDVIYINTYGDDYYIVMYKAIDNLNANAEVANQFFIMVSIGLVIIGSVIMFLFARKVTEPIVELKEITEEIAQQDFSHKFEVKTHDEIGQLGANINKMSSELDKAMTSLKEDIKRKEAIDSMRKRFISNVSHELKTPIGIIKGYVEGIKYDVYESEKEKAIYYDVIINETDKMNAMLGQLLSLSTMDSATDTMNLKVFNMAVLIDEVVTKFNRAFEDKGITLHKDAKDDAFIEADYLKIEQVITNYVTNAINHVEGHKEIKISLRRCNKKVVVAVYNSGANIPLQEADNIWESFYKVDKARTREYGGTGLGLSIVRTIMEKHKGKYGFTNRDEGVEFWFELEEYLPED